MILILSTCTRKRYKDNLLAALSTPLNTNLQYRYTRDLIKNDIIKYSGKIINLMRLYDS